MIWFNVCFLIIMAYYLYEIGSRLYWNQKYFNDKTKLHDIFSEMISKKEINPEHISKYLDISWTFRDVNSKKDFDEYIKNKEEALSFVPSIQKEKRRKKIDDLLNSD